MKTKKIFAFMLVCALVISGFSGASLKIKADTAYLLIQRTFNRVIDAEPGQTVHVKMPVIAISSYAYNPIVVTVYEDTDPFTTSNVTLTQQGQESALITTNEYTYVEFDIYMKDSASIGNYDLGVKFTYDATTDSGTSQITETHNLSVRVSDEKDPAQIAISDITYKQADASIGNDFSVSFTIENEGEIEALNTYYSIDYGTTGIAPNYSVETIKVGSLKGGESKKVTLDMKVLSTAEAGLKTLTANFKYKNAEGKEYTAAKSIYITVKSTSVASTEDASLVLSESADYDDILAGSDLKLKGTIENIGAKKATDIQLSITDGTGVSSGILEDYNSDGISVKDIASSGKRTFTIPLTISATASAGLKELTVQLTYNDSKSKSHTVVKKYYVTVVEAETEAVSGVAITNISQSPSSPMVGEAVSVSFTIENKNKKPVTSVTIAGKELSNAGFLPISSDPTKKIGRLAAGQKKNVTMQFTAGSSISEGLNPLTLTCSYLDSSNSSQSFDTVAYILNVQNSSKSKPKLIVSDYGTDVEVLKAGSEFELRFSLKNTHISKPAKNIKVTVSQKTDSSSTGTVFTTSKGSNSFYIAQIQPGETLESTLPMKVKSDAATGSYELTIDVEYEYDGMTDAEQEAGGVKDSNTIKLQAEENPRPVIENIVIGTFDLPTVNMSTAMSFEFYNMGKSKLENVYFTFEGDFQLETGEMFFLGTVEPGASEYVEPNVIPLIEGNATGTITIHFENSNGDEQTVTKDMPETIVQAEMLPTDGSMGDIPVISDTVEAPKDILPLWLFVGLQIGILVIFIPVTRLIIIRIHKRKIMKAEDRI